MKRLLAMLLVLSLLSGMAFAAGIPDINDGTRRLDDADPAVEPATCSEEEAACRLVLADGTTSYYPVFDHRVLVWASWHEGDRYITLLKDQTVANSLKPGEEWRDVPTTVVDLNGHTVTYTGKGNVLNTAWDSHVHYKNGTIIQKQDMKGVISDGGSSNVQSDRYGYPATSELTLENVTLVAPTTLCQAWNWNTTLNIVNSTIYVKSGMSFQKSNASNHFEYNFTPWQGTYGYKVNIENSLIACEEGPLFTTTDAEPTVTISNSTLMLPSGQILADGATVKLTTDSATQVVSEWPEGVEQPEMPVPTPLNAPTKANNTEEEIAIMQAAVAEMAASFYRRTLDTRYDFLDLMPMDRYSGGIGRTNSGMSVADIAKDNLFYTNCAQFVWSVYEETFGRGPFGASGRDGYVRNYNTYLAKAIPEEVVAVFECEVGSREGRKEFADYVESILQPGDLFSCLDTSVGTNHIQMYVGDIYGDGGDWVIHSNGDPYGSMGDSETPTVKLQSKGILMQRIQSKDYNSILILRPINTIDYDELTETAKTRLEYKGLDVIREAELYQYQDVQPGQEVEIRLKAFNTSTAPMTLSFTVPAPEGAQIVAGSLSEGAKLQEDGVILWNVDLAAGEEKILTYKIRVAAPAGATVVLPAVMLDTMPIREMRWYVGGEPVNEETLRTLDEQSSAAAGITATDIAFAKEFYQKVLGQELDLPDTFAELVDGLFDYITVPGMDTYASEVLQPKAYSQLTDEYKAVYDMIIPEHLVGYMVWLGVYEENANARNRALTYFAEGYRPGDVFLILGGSTGATEKLTPTAANVNVAIYLGDGKVAVPSGNGTGIKIATFNKEVTMTVKCPVVLVLRPGSNFPDTLGYLHPEAEPKAVVEIPEMDPIYKESSGIILYAAIGAAVVAAAAVVLVVLKKKKKAE